jgi:SAM-dependent methyltransferase
MSSALPLARNYHRWILDLITPHLRGAVLEIGCGYGQYTVELARHVECLVSIDCDAECVARMSCLPDHVEARIADLTALDFLDRVGADSYDGIVCLNVLEHLDDDRAALSRLWAALKPGGRLLLIVPAHPALYGPMDALAGHFRRYVRRSLRGRLSESAFEIDELRYINPLGGLGWWVNAKLFRPTDLSAPNINRQILGYDRFVQPLSRVLDRVTRSFFGQSLWAVARRPIPSGTAEEN